MRINCKFNGAAFLSFGLLGFPVSLLAAETGSAEAVLLKNGAMSVVKGGLTQPMTNEVALPLDINVTTNGVFRVKGGKQRHLAEGQVLGADGMLMSPDGGLRPVFDHVGLLAGKAILMKDGESVPLQDDFEFPNGSHVSADGYLHGGSGTRRKLLDGEMIELTGKTIPANDTVLLKDGKVIVQKDGSLLELAPSSSLMMNDGTKVFGDGSVLGKDGVKKPLLAGEILKLQGVMPK